MPFTGDVKASRCVLIEENTEPLERMDTSESRVSKEDTACENVSICGPDLVFSY